VIIYDTNYDFSGERFKVTYQIFERPERAKELARLICVEQTIEFPEEIVGDRIRRFVLGQVEDLQITEESSTVTIAYPVEIVGNDVTQFLNVIMGNCSLFPNVKIIDIQLAESFRTLFTGPRFGVEGLREFLKIENRPLLATAIKPMSLSADQLAEMAYKLALGGIDIIKDDHGLADQPFSHFEERVLKVTKAVQKANRETGFNTVYSPNITSVGPIMLKKAKFVKEIGSGAVLISPALCGFGGMIQVKDEVGLPILSHPAFIGGYLSVMDHRVLLGKLQRVLGADICIFPNYGGRFSFSKQECLKIDQGLKEPFEWLPPALPAPAGGMNIKKVTEMVATYGKDVVLLIGGALHKLGPDLADSVRKFRDETQRACELLFKNA